MPWPTGLCDDSRVGGLGFFSATGVLTTVFSATWENGFRIQFCNFSAVAKISSTDSKNISESLANLSNENTILKGEIAYLETRNNFYKSEIIEKKSDIKFLNKRLEKLEDINQKLTENLHKLVMQKNDN